MLPFFPFFLFFIWRLSLIQLQSCIWNRQSRVNIFLSLSFFSLSVCLFLPFIPFIYLCILFSPFWFSFFNLYFYLHLFPLSYLFLSFSQHPHMHTDIHKRIYTCIHARIYTCTHTHIFAHPHQYSTKTYTKLNLEHTNTIEKSKQTKNTQICKRMNK